MIQVSLRIKVLGGHKLRTLKYLLRTLAPLADHGGMEKARSVGVCGDTISERNLFTYTKTKFQASLRFLVEG
jgi:hypothetical protein